MELLEGEIGRQIEQPTNGKLTLMIEAVGWGGKKKANKNKGCNHRRY